MTSFILRVLLVYVRKKVSNCINKKKKKKIENSRNIKEKRKINLNNETMLNAFKYRFITKCIIFIVHAY